MNKQLEELSKPVGYDYQIAGACIADGHNEKGKWVDWDNKLTRYCPPEWMIEEGKVTELKPLYSQEYVNALQQRIAELEHEREESRRVMSDNQQQADYIVRLERENKRLFDANVSICERAESAEKRIAELEAKLATPVRLPELAACPLKYVGSPEWAAAEANNKALAKFAAVLREQGFMVDAFRIEGEA